MIKLRMQSMIVVLAIFLGGCLTAPTLPDNAAGDSNIGVLAIPKNTVNEPGVPLGLIGYLTEIQIRKKGENTIYKSIRVDRNAGRAFKFLNDIEPGDYVLSGYATVPADSSVAVNSNKTPIRQLNKLFSIKPGSITVLPLQILTQRKSISVHRFSSSVSLVSLKQDLTEWQELLQKSKNYEQWEVVWPK